MEDGNCALFTVMPPAPNTSCLTFIEQIGTFLLEGKKNSTYVLHVGNSGHVSLVYIFL